MSTSQFALNLPDDNRFGGPPGPSPINFKGYVVLFAVLVPGDHTLVLSDHFAADPSSLDITVHLHVSAPGRP